MLFFSVAGGATALGNADHEDFVKNADLAIRESLFPSIFAARLAAKFLRDDGLLMLTGAKDALDGTPDKIGFGAAKAAIHHLTASLGRETSGMPKNSTVLSILPLLLDTPHNREELGKEDRSLLTPLHYVSDLLLKFLKNAGERPRSGSLLQLITKEGETNVQELSVELHN